MQIGIDLGGTKIEGIVLAADGAVVTRERVDTPRGEYRRILVAVIELVKRLERKTGEKPPVGVGTPGSLSPAALTPADDVARGGNGLMRNANSTELNGHPLKADLEAALGRDIRIANDANCFALSEATDGAGAGREIVFAVIAGTGVGAGIVVRGHILTGVNAIAGEWGHNPLPWPRAGERPGPACYCGRQGCIETFLSGPGLEQDYAAYAGEKKTAREIANLAERGDETAEAALQRFENRMARGLGHVINILDPHVIVLGGGISNIERLYQNVPAQWAEYIFSDTVETRLLPPRHGDASGVRGAAWLWND